MFISTTLFNNNYNGKENLKDEAILNGNINYNYTRDKDAYIEDFSHISKIIVTPTADVSLSIN
jgi:ABC-type polysaccharide/polyol phosphate transport system ATPase subunit